MINFRNYLKMYQFRLKKHNQKKGGGGEKLNYLLFDDCNKLSEFNLTKLVYPCFLFGIVLSIVFGVFMLFIQL